MMTGNSLIRMYAGTGKSESRQFTYKYVPNLSLGSSHTMTCHSESRQFRYSNVPQGMLRYTPALSGNQLRIFSLETFYISVVII